jgi:phosphoribosylaminoimidazole-succinocarboxamide synthase
VVQKSFDKQFVRNWLTSSESGWDRHGSQSPPPLPNDIIEATRGRYIDAYERISGLSFDDWIGPGA